MARLDAKGVTTRADAPSVQPPKGEFLKSKMGAKPGVPTSLKGVLFGPPKTKKTTAACSGGSTLLINFDPEGYATGTLKGRKDIDIVEPETLLETEKIIEAIVGGEADSYDFIVVDSVTFMFQRFGGREILKTFQAGKDVRRAYGFAGAAAGQIINDLAMLKRNILFVAHLQKEYEEDDGVEVDQEMGEHEVSLAVTPMVWKILGPAVGFIGRTFKEDRLNLDTGNTETQFFVSFNDGSRSPAGSRYDMAGRYEITDTLLSDLTTTLL